MDTSTLLTGGGAGLLTLGLAGYLLRQIPADRQDYRQALVADRQDYRQALADEQARTMAAEARTAEALARERAAQAEVDTERTLRRTTETALAAAQAQVVAQRQMIDWLTTQRGRTDHPQEGP